MPRRKAPPTDEALREQARHLLQEYMTASGEILRSGGRLSAAHAGMTRTLSSIVFGGQDTGGKAAPAKSINELSIAELEAMLAAMPDEAKGKAGAGKPPGAH